MSMKRFLLVIGVTILCLGAVPARADLVPFDTLTVLGTGETATSIALDVGQLYRFEASGTYYANDGIYADAEYASGPTSYAWLNGVERYMSYGENLLDLQVNSGFVNWGDTFNPDHVYNLPWLGTGAPVSFNIYDIAPGNNSGFLTVNIYAVPIPAAVLLGALGIGVAGLKLRKFV